MSDPVTNAEVEDVLSSIRRLVSEDKRPVQATKPQAQSAATGLSTPLDEAAGTPKPGPDRLVLTPALRVTETPQDAQAATDGPHGKPQHDPQSEDAEAEAPAKPQIEINTLVTDDSPIDFTAPPDAQEQMRTETRDVEVVENMDASQDEEDQLFDDPSHDYSTDPYNFDDDTNDDGEGDDSYLRRYAVAQSEAEDDAFEDDLAYDDALELSQTAGMKSAEQNDAAEAMTQASASDVDAPDVDAAGSAEKTVALTAKIAALETAIGQISETWEPDDAGDSDYAGSEAKAMIWEDVEHDASAAEPEVAPAAEAETLDAEAEDVLGQSETRDASPVMSDTDVMQEDRSAQTTQANAAEPAEASSSETLQAAAAATAAAAGAREGFDYTEEEQLIDEEALRDLISDIVRSELQGALGERITRNVRKLVRREIHRALTAQDLE